RFRDITEYSTNAIINPQKSQRQASAEAYFGDVRGQRYEKVWKVILFWSEKTVKYGDDCGTKVLKYIITQKNFRKIFVGLGRIK
ncbi:MAG: hypothetical protein K6F20_06240, partial [Bacteroidaceae bacterium]|nr:hypothetical protein [Bacteroidaceae bacterium]